MVLRGDGQLLNLPLLVLHGSTMNRNSCCCESLLVDELNDGGILINLDRFIALFGS